VIDITGKVVYNELFEAIATSFTKQLPLGSMAKGVYSVRVTGAEKSLSTKLIHQ
ncbi:MAG: T9SS type A sorting domain-containing protein, partial [Bacteroidales bacterium]|nr:T9SS type A sorting domain-containing protein [Bacteroidales bacterium]